MKYCLDCGQSTKHKGITLDKSKEYHMCTGCKSVYLQMNNSAVKLYRKIMAIPTTGVYPVQSVEDLEKELNEEIKS